MSDTSYPVPSTVDANIHCGDFEPDVNLRQYGDFLSARFAFGEVHLAIMFPAARRSAFERLFRKLADDIAAISAPR